MRRRWRHVQRAPSTEEEQELRSDELDALTAIFDQDMHACTDPGALTLVRVRLREGDDSLVLRFELPLGYPTTALPRVDLEGSAAGPAVRDKVLRALREVERCNMSGPQENLLVRTVRAPGECKYNTRVRTRSYTYTVSERATLDT